MEKGLLQRRKSSLIDESEIDIGHFMQATDNSVLDSIKAVVLWSCKLEETIEKWSNCSEQVENSPENGNFWNESRIEDLFSSSIGSENGSENGSVQSGSINRFENRSVNRGQITKTQS